jgi:hypothetical protein
MRSCHTPDQLDSCFDDTHAVASAGRLLPATLAERLGIKQAADALIDPGRAARRVPARPQAADPGPHHAGGWDCIDTQFRIIPVGVGAAA